MKWENPFPYQSAIRNRFDEDTFSHSVFSLRFGKHVAAYKGYMEAQNYLSKKAQDTKILVRALRRLPQVKDVTVVFENKVIGAFEVMSAFGLLNGNEITFDSEYTLPVFVDALAKSDRKLDAFGLISQERDRHELYCESREMYNHKHQPRLKYVSESPKNVTSQAFWNGFHGDDRKIRQKVIPLMGGLRKFDLSGLHLYDEGLFGFLRWSHTLEPIIGFASNLEDLRISPLLNNNPADFDPHLDLSSILHELIWFKNLKYLMLGQVESPESLLIGLLKENSNSLIDVTLMNVRITGDVSWSEILRKVRIANFGMLEYFVLLDCCEEVYAVRAQKYLRRITDKDPITEAIENQMNGSN